MQARKNSIAGDCCRPQSPDIAAKTIHVAAIRKFSPTSFLKEFAEQLANLAPCISQHVAVRLRLILRIHAAAAPRLHHGSSERNREFFVHAMQDGIERPRAQAVPMAAQFFNDSQSKQFPFLRHWWERAA